MNPLFGSGFGFDRFAYMRRFFNANIYGGRRPKPQAVKTAKQIRRRLNRKAAAARKRRNKGGQG